MMPFHQLWPDIAQREVRCVHLGSSPETKVENALPADEYAYVEFYCEDLDCDCRRVFLQVNAKKQPGKVFASINYGWEKEAFYRKRMPSPKDARDVVRGTLDPINEQSEVAGEFLYLFQHTVLD